MRSTESPQQAEKRQARRFAVMLPVKLDQGNGWTRNVSAAGVLFKLFYDPDPPFLPGSQIRLALVLEHLDAAVEVECVGEVVRVERAAGHVGVAVRIDSHRFDARKTGEVPEREPLPAGTPSEREPAARQRNEGRSDNCENG